MLTPTVSSSQPIGLRTRRTISAPRVAYATVETEAFASEMASFAFQSVQVSTVRTAPVTAIRTDPVHKASMRRRPGRPPLPAASFTGTPAVCSSVPAVMTSPPS